jgi:Family of unknown function (DUF6515)
MDTKHFSGLKTFALLAVVVLFSSTFTAQAYAQRMRVGHGPQAPAHLQRLPAGNTRVYMGGRPYYYHNGYFYRGWRGGYRMFLPPIGARFRYLPYGFWSFHVGPALYFYGGGVYFQYFPDANSYVVVPKPNQAPASPTSDEDVMNLTDGTTLSGVFMGATADSIKFQVKDEVRTVPITQVKSLNFAPSSFKEQK